MKITNEQIKELRESYAVNKVALRELEEYIDEEGMTSEGLIDVTESFEQGWNNAMEFVFSKLGIKYL